MRPDIPVVATPEQREALQPLRDRGRLAHRRLQVERDALVVARAAYRAAEMAALTAERTFIEVNREINNAGYHDLGHLRTFLGE